jgi:hypothetical protein
MSENNNNNNGKKRDLATAVKSFDIPTSGKRMTPAKGASPFLSAAWSHDGKTIALSVPGWLIIYNAATMHVKEECKAQLGPLLRLSFSKDDSTVRGITDSGDVHILSCMKLADTGPSINYCWTYGREECDDRPNSEILVISDYSFSEDEMTIMTIDGVKGRISLFTCTGRYNAKKCVLYWQFSKSVEINGWIAGNFDRHSFRPTSRFYNNNEDEAKQPVNMDKQEKIIVYDASCTQAKILNAKDLVVIPFQYQLGANWIAANNDFSLMVEETHGAIQIVEVKEDHAHLRSKVQIGPYGVSDECTVEFSPNDKVIAIAYSYETTSSEQFEERFIVTWAKVSDLNVHVTKPLPRPASCLVFSPDAKKLLVLHRDGLSFDICDIDLPGLDDDDDDTVVLFGHIKNAANTS